MEERESNRTANLRVEHKALGLVQYYLGDIASVQRTAVDVGSDLSCHLHASWIPFTIQVKSTDDSDLDNGFSCARGTWDAYRYAGQPIYFFRVSNSDPKEPPEYCSVRENQADIDRRLAEDKGSKVFVTLSKWRKLDSARTFEAEVFIEHLLQADMPLRAPDIRPELAGLVYASAAMLLAISVQFIVDGKYRTAETLVRSIVSFDCDHWNPFFVMGIIAANDGRKEAAVKYFGHVIVLCDKTRVGDDDARQLAIEKIRTAANRELKRLENSEEVPIEHCWCAIDPKSWGVVQERITGMTYAEIRALVACATETREIPNPADTDLNDLREC